MRSWRRVEGLWSSSAPEFLVWPLPASSLRATFHRHLCMLQFQLLVALVTVASIQEMSNTQGRRLTRPQGIPDSLLVSMPTTISRTLQSRTPVFSARFETSVLWTHRDGGLSSGMTAATLQRTPPAPQTISK